MGTLEPINLNSKIAYYLQVKDAIQYKIDAGEYRPGDKLPSEGELCDLLGVSRTVVRQALMELQYDGLVRKRKGKGTYVAEPKIDMALAQFRTCFQQDISYQERKVEARVLFQDIVPAPSNVAQKLQIKEGGDVLEIHRLCFVDGEPIGLSVIYLVGKYCAQLLHADLSHSLYETMHEICAVDFEYSERIIEAVVANERESALFGVDRGAPMLLMKTVNYTAEMIPIEYNRRVLRGDRSRLEAKIMHYDQFQTEPTALIDNNNHFFFSRE